MYILKYISPVEIYIFSLKIYISFCKWRPPDISGGCHLVSGGRHLEDEMYISGGRHLENEMYISSEKMYILTGEMYISSTSQVHFKYISPVEIYIFSLEIYISFSKWRPPDISGGRHLVSGGRHLESEMYISSGKMYISTGEMYYSYLAAARYKYTSDQLKYTSLLMTIYIFVLALMGFHIPGRHEKIYFCPKAELHLTNLESCTV